MKLYMGPAIHTSKNWSNLVQAEYNSQTMQMSKCIKKKFFTFYVDFKKYSDDGK